MAAIERRYARSEPSALVSVFCSTSSVVGGISDTGHRSIQFYELYGVERVSALGCSDDPFRENVHPICEISRAGDVVRGHDHRSTGGGYLSQNLIQHRRCLLVETGMRFIE